MSNIVNAISRHLNDSEINDISDFDDTIGGVRVCVEFNILLNEVDIQDVAVLDNDWDLLDEDTAVLKSRLKGVINEFNRSNNELTSQSADIRQDQHEYAPMKTESKLIGQRVECEDRPNEIGIISFYNPDNGDMDIKYSEATLLTHISKCKIVK